MTKFDPIELLIVLYYKLNGIFEVGSSMLLKIMGNPIRASTIERNFLQNNLHSRGRGEIFIAYIMQSFQRLFLFLLVRTGQLKLTKLYWKHRCQPTHVCALILSYLAYTGPLVNLTYIIWVYTFVWVTHRIITNTECLPYQTVVACISAAEWLKCEWYVSKMSEGRAYFY